jgi:hypothetical protein
VVVINQIRLCDDGKTRDRDLTKVDKVVVHQIGESLGKTGAQIAASFRDTSKFAAGSYTGGEMPYSFVIRTNGIIDQCLRLTDTGPHAKRWNSSSVSIALIGDFNKHEPTNEQVCSLIELCVPLYAYGMSIHGHTELPGSSSDPAKRCPGKLLDMDVIRSEVHFIQESNTMAAVRDFGIEF